MNEDKILTKPSKIVMLLEDLEFGGTQRQTLELARNLDKRIFATELWLMRAGEDLAPVSERGGVQIVRLSNKRRVGPRSLADLWRRLKSSRVDLLLLLTVIPNIWGRILGNLAGVPVILATCRGGWSPFRQHERWLWPFSDHLLCNTLALKECLVEACKVPERRITIIPNGVDVDFFRPPFTAPPQDKTVILCVARLVPDKDHETLISAFDLIARQHQDVELWMAGNGERLAALKQLAARSVAHGRIRFLRGQPDVRPLLHLCTLFALSSCREAMPNAVLEAMACGLPVIATATGGLPELVEHGRTGFLVPKQNAPALARAMEKLLMDEKARAAFGKRARERVEQCYSVSAMVRSHTDLFCSLLDGRDRGIGHGRRRMGSPWRIK